MSDEREYPEDLGDELPVDPHDHDRLTPPPGIYDAAIAMVRYQRLPDSDKYNPGLNQAQVSYRLENCDDPQYNGCQVRGFGKNLTMVTNGGADKCFGWLAWCKTMNIDPKAPPRASELQGLPVKLRLGTKAGKEGRVFATVDELWSRFDG